jgi:hypothetical protein
MEGREMAVAGIRRFGLLDDNLSRYACNHDLHAVAKPYN